VNPVAGIGHNRWTIARKPQHGEQGMQNDEGKRHVLLASAFAVPCSIFCGSLVLIQRAILRQGPDGHLMSQVSIQD
jgi:hypothetical protein